MLKVSPATVPNSMLPGDAIAFREEGCRRIGWFLFPDSHSPLAFPLIWR